MYKLDPTTFGVGTLFTNFADIANKADNRDTTYVIKWIDRYIRLEKSLRSIQDNSSYLYFEEIIFVKYKEKLKFVEKNDKKLSTHSMSVLTSLHRSNLIRKGLL